MRRRHALFFFGTALAAEGAGEGEAREGGGEGSPLEGYLAVLAFAALPALGNFAGGLLAEVLRPSRRLLSLALHAAAGIVLSVVAVELMPQALQATLGHDFRYACG